MKYLSLLLFCFALYASDCDDNLKGKSVEKIAKQLLYEATGSELGFDRILVRIKKIYVSSLSVTMETEAKRLEKAYDKRKKK